ncbi:glycosyltransferase family 2 protein [Aciditerrimonas ferrireducens]|uniref:Glycosyltransferase family 2 protein n=1 Tax=Aciditerrimonas ferrireducens TaxID=667306 RepID=A0ABV6C4P7_9ACTN
MPDAAVTVVVPTRDRPRLLADALGSLLAQTRSDWRAIVVHDGPLPATDLALVPTDPRIELLALEEPRGAAAARNRALPLVGTPFVAFLDDDDRFRPDHLARALAALEAGAEVTVSGCQYVEETVEPTGDRRATGATWAYDPSPYSDTRLAAGNFIPLPSVCCRTDALAQAGPFDEGLTVYEDWELLLRLCPKRAVQVLPEPTVEVSVRPAADSLSRAEPLATWLECFDQVCQRYPAWSWPVQLGRTHTRLEILIRMARPGDFDAEAYLAANPDVAQAGVDPVRHAVLHGFREGRVRVG